jgi:hypothetical protein
MVMRLGPGYPATGFSVGSAAPRGAAVGVAPTPADSPTGTGGSVAGEAGACSINASGAAEGMAGCDGALLRSIRRGPGGSVSVICAVTVTVTRLLVVQPARAVAAPAVARPSPATATAAKPAVNIVELVLMARAFLGSGAVTTVLPGLSDSPKSAASLSRYVSGT